MDRDEDERQNFEDLKQKIGRRRCAVCGKTTPAHLFKFPKDKDRGKKWCLALKWNVPPEKLSYIENNAKVCDGHFSDCCYTDSLKTRLSKFSCPHTTKNDTFACPCVENVEVTTPSDCSTLMDTTLMSSGTTASSSKLQNDVQVTPKTKKIRNLRSNVSKLRKSLYSKNKNTTVLQHLKAKLADKPLLYDFILSQLRMESRGSKGKRWSTKEKCFALEIYLHSPSAYKVLRRYFHFPSKATLHRYTYNVAKSPGFCPNLIKCLKAQSHRMTDEERLCVLVLDEISIKPGLAYAADVDAVEGFSSARKDSKTQPLFATHALVFMARGIYKNWKQVLGYYFTSKSDVYFLKKILYEAIDILHSCSMEVIAVITDQGSTNQKLSSKLHITTKKTYFEYNNQKIFFIFDPPHLLKSVRNNLKNHGIYFTENGKKGFANWSHIQEFYEKDSKNKYNLCKRLTRKHIEVSGLKKMNVKLAAQVLSHSVSSGLFSYVGMRELGSRCLETAEFLYNMNKLFDSVNGRTLQNANKDCDPVKKDSYHIEFWKSMIPFIESWKIISSKSNRKICAASKKGWIITLMSFIQISEILLGRVEYFLTGRFNQDCLENMFSTVRRRGGFSDNPDCLGFRHIIHKIIIANFLKKTHSKNCADDGDYTLVDFAKYDKPTIIDIINSNSEDPKDDSEVNENDADILINDINVIECNVLAYICGYFAKKFLNSHECTDCKKLLMDETKALDTHTIALYFKDYDHVNSTSGLKWPTKKLLEYFTDLHNIFHCNINLLYLRSGVCHAFYNLLFDVSNNLFENHSVHKIEAQNFFVNSYVRMMVKHNIKQLNNELKINAPPPKKMKYNLT